VDVQDVHVHFGSGKHKVRAVNGVSFTIGEGECVGLVGESGCGKSTLGRTLLRLETPAAGVVRFRGQDVHQYTREEARAFTREAQMIFQDPYGSLNPRMPVGDALREVLSVHREGTRKERLVHAEQLFGDVGLDPAYMRRYPHEFSGGQRQRIGIARALAVGPRLLIADEPVSALDVSVQVQILNLLKDLQAKHGLTYLFVAHDLAVVRYVCTRVMVMYLGHIVERAPSARLYAGPRHPYTRALMSAVPDVDKSLKGRKGEAGRIVLSGDVPSPTQHIAGCPFHTRCPFVRDRCRTEQPALVGTGDEHQVACHYADEIAETTARHV
jgi:peptide/nickel transport system ATP-binding protein/oligopeptide transport system ATP-binding protein